MNLDKLSIDIESTKMARKLRAIAKHAESLANELDAIDNEWQCDCGSTKFTDYYSDRFIRRECEKCSEQYAMPNDDLPTPFEGSD